MSIIVPPSGDFNAWTRVHPALLAIDWDGTCKDTMSAKWRQGFNLAVPKVWPALTPYQDRIDELCYQLNLAPGAVTANRFLMLRRMMNIWKDEGMPVPDLAGFPKAVEHVESSGLSHSVNTYRSLMDRFGFDDAPLRWSDVSDDFIAQASRTAPIFPNCRETLSRFADRADIVVVSAAKNKAVADDLVNDDMEHLFQALLAQDFLPKKGTLTGLAKKYDRVLFIADGKGDMAIAATVGVQSFEIRLGEEAQCWIEVRDVIKDFLKQA